jgi:hypothetical protein
LVLNGFQDWYLPDIEEMKKIVLNHLLLKNYNSNGNYWLSNIDENESEYAYTCQGLASYGGNTSSISSSFLVRPIRKF